MGVIAKQSIKGSVYTYAGALTGFINTGLLMPEFFAPEQIGLVNLLIAFTLIFSQLGNLGFSGVITRLFPYFRNNEKKHNGILTLGLLISVAGFLLTLLLFFISEKYLVKSNYKTSELLSDNIFYVPVLTFFMILFYLFDNYNKVLFDAVSGIFLREFFVRLADLFIIILYIFDYIDFKTFVFWYIVIFALPSVILMFILIKRKVFYLTGINKNLLLKLKKEIIGISLFWILSGFAGIAVQSIDKYMTNYYLGLAASGIYAVTFYFGMLVIMPARSLRKISSVIIAEAWKKNDIKTISEIYEKSSVNLFIAGSLVVIGLWVNIDNIFEIIPEYAAGKYVVLFISLLSLADMSSGTAAAIIGNSGYYKINAYVMFFTLLSIIITNYFFINLWGLKGAAFASFISVSFAVFFRFLFLYKKYKLQPYSLRHVKILFTGLLTLFVNFLIPEIDNVFADIVVRSFAVSVVFASLIYFFKVSEDVNSFVLKIIDKLKSS
ncbi:MAG: hypothetical protein GXO50_03420 [Chlorobi bacterium]|nr:hypothetical protein [Chlorobiota bacterium]